MSAKGPTVKRILKEAAELSQNPSPDYHAAPLEADLYQWHFTLRGPPAPSPFANGIYHGQITLPPSYPLKPPNFRFLTPSGRFEVNREICLSISGHHEESWQPAWGIRTALVAIRSFMDSEAGGQVGGMSAAENVRRRLAGESKGFKCAGCGGRSNEAILKEQEELCEGGKEEEERRAREEAELAKGISFAPKEDGAPATSAAASASNEKAGPSAATPSREASTSTPPSTLQRQPPTPSTVGTTPRHTNPPAQPQLLQPSRDVWLDRAIIGVFCALIFMLLRRVI